MPFVGVTLGKTPPILTSHSRVLQGVGGCRGVEENIARRAPVQRALTVAVGTPLLRIQQVALQAGLLEDFAVADWQVR